MKRSPHKVIIAGVAALSIAITGLSASAAHADSTRTGNALAALLGLAVIGAIIHESEKDKRRARERARANTHSQHIKPRPLPNRVAKRKVLPDACLRQFNVIGGGVARVFAQRCMDRNFAYVADLPRACERRIQTDRGIRRGWAARCLRHNGYRMARR